MVFRHRTGFGRGSEIMSLGTECAGEQGAFWEFRDARFQSGSSNVAGQISLARTLGLDVPRFTACMEDQRYRTSLDEDRAAAMANGIFTQPAFVISSGGQSIKRVGWTSAEELSQIIDGFLN